MARRSLAKRGFWGEYSPETEQARVAKATYDKDDGGRCGDCEYCTSQGAKYPYCELTEERVNPETGGCDVCEMDGSEF